jgi:hypothetical protein
MRKTKEELENLTDLELAILANELNVWGHYSAKVLFFNLHTDKLKHASTVEELGVCLKELSDKFKSFQDDKMLSGNDKVVFDKSSGSFSIYTISLPNTSEERTLLISEILKVS